MIKSSQERRSFINAFSNNLNIVNLFPNPVGVFSPDQNYGRIDPWVSSYERGFKGCVMFSFPRVDTELGTDMLFEKLTPEIGG